MKRTFCILFAFLLVALSAGCGKTETKETVTETTAAAGVDVDLTKLSGTMVYSEVYNMMSTPTNYIGKTIRAKGPFTVYHDEENDNYFFAVLINDATACCSQGLEFVWAGEHSYPDGYPKVGTEIIVTGTFHDYMDGEQQYYHLEDASVVLAQA